MKICLTLFLLFFSLLLWAQDDLEKEPSLKNVFNEFHISVNHGIPFSPGIRTFFGAGMGANHVFREEKIVGARTGLELDFLHFWEKDAGPPESDQVKNNQHFYFTTISIPANLQLNFGRNVRFSFELGARLGIVAYMIYTADVLHTGPSYDPYGTFEYERTSNVLSSGFVGLNSGIGARIPLNKKMDLLIRPTIQINGYSVDMVKLYGQLQVGIHLK
ncbi:hypothetical protein [Fluviicola sp.]|uniref:hypothetical protein n=1 Tax=Fluviicola sp. TaxID=1917219 RepID=UPI00260D4089|nr:hypothetical protein [Fluviicola sp.]